MRILSHRMATLTQQMLAGRVQPEPGRNLYTTIGGKTMIAVVVEGWNSEELL